jgi:broad specificity phosphatase PhoE
MNMRLVARLISVALAFLWVAAAHAQQADLKSLVPQLKSGGYVIVFRHGATDPAQQDVLPFDFADMTKQRQLSEKGRETATAIGQAMRSLGIPIGEVYTSELNRAVETGKLLANKDVTPTPYLTDSSGGSASGMAAGVGGGAAAGSEMRQLMSTKPAAGVNTLVVTHKTNIGDAFGKSMSDIGEGEAIIVEPDGNGSFTVVGRVGADQWSAVANAK